MIYKWNIHWKDYYRILQVHPTAGQEVIKAAYARLARIYHPDLNQESSSIEMMKDVNEAYEVLGKLETRRLYHPEWLKKRRELYNQETPPRTSSQSDTVEQSNSTLRSTKTKPHTLLWVNWVIGFAAIFVIISLIIIFNNISSSSPDIPKTAPATGTYIVKDLSEGSGELFIDNGLDLDAVAILSNLTEPKIPQMAVYVRAGTSFTVTGISDNVYILYFSFGKDWNSNSNRFLEKVAYQQFAEEFDFRACLRKSKILSVI